MDNDLKSIIRKYFKDKKSKKDIPNTCVNKFLKLNQDVKEKFDDILKNDYRFNSYFDIIFFYLFYEDFKKCAQCGKDLTYTQMSHYYNFCSVKCQRNNKDIKEKIKKTNLKKYGCEYISQAKEIKDKVKRTNLEHYGVEYPSQSEEVKNKTKRTNLERYGVEWILSSKDIQKQIKNTIKEKYGVENISLVPEVNEKIKKTNLERYGVENCLNSKYIQEKSKATNLKRYGVEKPFQSKEIQEKAKLTHLDKYGSMSPTSDETIKQKQMDSLKKYRSSEQYQIDKFKREQINIEKYGVKNLMMLKAWDNINNLQDKLPLFDLADYVGKRHEYKWKCKKCGYEYFSNYDGGRPTKKCPNCELLNGISFKEKELLDFCKEYFNDIKENNRTLIYPLELDVVIPEIKLAIEFNGNYWHSVLGWKFERKNKTSYFNYHLNKTKLCNEKGYRLIHIWEDEWDLHKDELKSKLIDIFKGNEKLDFYDNEIILDRSWYNNIEIPGYVLKEEIQPEIISRNELDVENCGYLKYVLL